MEQTLVIVKPDGVQRGLVGAIIFRLERRGLRLSALKLLQVDEMRARSLYEVHLDKRFYNTLVSYISSSPVVAMVWQGLRAITQCNRSTNRIPIAFSSNRGNMQWHHRNKPINRYSTSL
ncbi:MAG: nucleoside-diphosphate kinase [Dehalococcoidia bacterium]|nr:nucleoside-diphosphate kinase [Dehalococcoidia bacterium]